LLAQDDIYLPHGGPFDPHDNDYLPGMDVEAAH